VEIAYAKIVSNGCMREVNARGMSQTTSSFAPSARRIQPNCNAPIREESIVLIATQRSTQKHYPSSWI